MTTSKSPLLAAHPLSPSLSHPTCELVPNSLNSAPRVWCRPLSPRVLSRRWAPPQCYQLGTACPSWTCWCLDRQTANTHSTCTQEYTVQDTTPSQSAWESCSDRVAIATDTVNNRARQNENLTFKKKSLHRII